MGVGLLGGPMGPVAVPPPWSLLPPKGLIRLYLPQAASNSRFSSANFSG